MRLEKITGLACAAAVAAGSLTVGLAGVAAPAPHSPAGKDICRGYSVNLWNQTVPSGSSTYIISHNAVHFKNCGTAPTKARPDLTFMPDPSCKVVQPGVAVEWPWQSSNGLNQYRGMAKC